MKIFQTLVQADGDLRHQSQSRLRELAQAHSDEVQLICSHDPVTLERSQQLP